VPLCQPAPHFARRPYVAYLSSIERLGNRRHPQLSALGRTDLAGKGDLRTTRWSPYSAVYMTVVPVASLERAIYSFHHLHHALTLSKFNLSCLAAATAADIEQKGILAAVRNLVVHEMKR
jgi:hypothetical protein